MRTPESVGAAFGETDVVELARLLQRRGTRGLDRALAHFDRRHEEAERLARARARLDEEVPRVLAALRALGNRDRERGKVGEDGLLDGGEPGDAHVAQALERLLGDLALQRVERRCRPVLAVAFTEGEFIFG